MNRRNWALFAAGAALAAKLTENLTADQLLFVFLACVAGLGAIYVSEIFRMLK